MMTSALLCCSLVNVHALFASPRVPQRTPLHGLKMSGMRTGGDTPRDAFCFGYEGHSVGVQGGIDCRVGPIIGGASAIGEQPAAPAEEPVAEPEVAAEPAAAVAAAGPPATPTRVGRLTPKAAELDEPTYAAPTYPRMGLSTPRDDFCFGSGQAVIGFQGGAGKGMGLRPKRPRRARMGGPTPADDFRFGVLRTAVGIQGGIDCRVGPVIGAKAAPPPEEAGPAAAEAATEAETEVEAVAEAAAVAEPIAAGM